MSKAWGGVIIITKWLTLRDYNSNTKYSTRFNDSYWLRLHKLSTVYVPSFPTGFLLLTRAFESGEEKNWRHMELLYRSTIPEGCIHCMAWSGVNLIAIGVSVEKEGFVVENLER